MKNTSLIFFILLLGFSLLNAEPYFAFRTGVKCSQCHVNKTGGGKRTNFGVAFAQGQLSANHLVGEDEIFFDGLINDYVSVGGNYRVEEQYNLAYDEAGQDLKSGRMRNVTESNIYFQFNLIADRLIFYWDVNATNGTAREIFALMTYETFYVKYGAILLPYGLRLLDDDEKAFTRSETGYTYDRSSLGVEIGYEPGPFSFVINYTLDNGSAIVQYIDRSWRVGVSGGVRFKNDQFFVLAENFSETYEAGVFAGFGIGSFTLFGEYDYVIRNKIKQQVWLAEADLEITKGVNLKVIHEANQPDMSVSIARNLSTRNTFGVEYFPNPNLILSLLARVRDGVPSNGFVNQDDIIARLHLFM